ncbi:MAG TPA: tetratricopeptide repeat protein [Terrimicrobiaceae bacterium]
MPKKIFAIAVAPRVSGKPFSWQIHDSASVVWKFVGTFSLIGALFVLQACGPQKMTTSPEEAILEGWKEYRLSEFNLALKRFESVRVSQPAGSKYYLQALYGEGSCWNHRRDGRDIAKAIAAYRAVIEEGPQSPLAPWCALDIVRTRHLAPADQSIDYPRLIQDYADVYARYPETPAGEEAFLYETNLSLPSADSANARRILESVEKFLTSHPNTPFLSQFYTAIAESYRRLDEPDLRIQYMIKALAAREVDPISPVDDRSTAYWTIAYASEFEAGNFALAREYYRRLIDEYPHDIRVFGARKALRRMTVVETTLREGRSLPDNLLGGVSVFHPGARK